MCFRVIVLQVVVEGIFFCLRGGGDFIEQTDNVYPLDRDFLNYGSFIVVIQLKIIVVVCCKHDCVAMALIQITTINTITRTQI